MAAVALAITGLGIASLMSYLNRLRTREMAIRISLGARRAEVLAALVQPALLLLTAGTAIGLAVAARSVLAHVLFGIRPGDPLTLGGAALLLFGIGALCAYLTARREICRGPPQVRGMGRAELYGDVQDEGWHL